MILPRKVKRKTKCESIHTYLLTLCDYYVRKYAQEQELNIYTCKQWCMYAYIYYLSEKHQQNWPRAPKAYKLILCGNSTCES